MIGSAEPSSAGALPFVSGRMPSTLPPPSAWCDRCATVRAVAWRWSLRRGGRRGGRRDCLTWPVHLVVGRSAPLVFARGGRCRSRAAPSPVRVVVPPVRAVRAVTAAAQAVRTHALVRVERPKDDAGEEERDDVYGVHQRIASRAALGLCDLGHCRVDECD